MFNICQSWRFRRLRVNGRIGSRVRATNRLHNRLCESYPIAAAVGYGALIDSAYIYMKALACDMRYLGLSRDPFFGVEEFVSIFAIDFMDGHRITMWVDGTLADIAPLVSLRGHILDPENLSNIEILDLGLFYHPDDLKRKSRWPE